MGYPEEEILQQVNSRNSVIEPQEENTSEQTDDNEAVIAPFPKGSFTEEYEELEDGCCADRGMRIYRQTAKLTDDDNTALNVVKSNGSNSEVSVR